MGNREVVLEQVRRAYAARDKGALDDLMAEFHPDAVFTLAGDEQCGGVAGSACGVPHLKERMGQLIDTFQFRERRVLTELVDGDRAAVHSRVTVRCAPKNVEQETEILDLFKLRDGKIVELIEFADTAVAAKMLS
ncbi:MULTISPECIES: nuclear transport factor 2 family protein [unclassified Bradyrhizobium]|uniref:nuclear transport factor 2 family protein n=1 Tax=unclassified Bradyrhizobium TaxID=2631580 RepID=UPI0028EEAE84|nr:MULTISPECIES: nuclear transport factor 2 family protein [unclassified Bradyrhizobium]